MDDVADGNADRVACAAFFLEDFSAAIFGAFENGILEAGRAVRQAREEKTVYGRGRPNRQHGIAVLAQDEGFDLSGGELEFLRDKGTETRSVEHGAKAIDLLRRQTNALHRKLCKNVHG